MWDLTTIIAINEKAHQECLRGESLTEEENQRYTRERDRNVQRAAPEEQR